MKKRTAIWLLHCVFLFGICNNLVAQKADNFKADNLFINKLYDVAAVEFERNIFYSKSDSSINEFLLKKSYCYKLLGRSDLAINTLNRIQFYPYNDLFFNEVAYEKALNFYLQQKYKEAEFILFQLSEIRVTKYSILYLLTLNNLEKWDEANLLYLSFIKNNKIEGANFELYNFKNEGYNLKTAKTLSYILPGLGQFYLKENYKGIMSLGLNIGLGYFTVASIIEGYYTSGILLGFPFLIRSYLGSQKNIGEIVRERNRIKKLNRNLILQKEILKIQEKYNP